MQENLQYLGAIISGIILFITGRKTSKIAEKKDNANAVEAMQRTYDVFLKHYKDEHDGLLSRLDGLELRNAILMESAETWERKFKELDKKYKDLQIICEGLKKKI
jgi:beta-galactosidase beta subunit